ncbi:MAG: peroxidase [Gammaproteobacteria bacterium]|nr:peroxidase [Gammaproteobacteria bacterium]
MTRELNLNDIQSNVTRAYGRFNFPFARYFFLHIEETAAGRAFVDQVREKVNTAARWTPESRPQVTLNIGFTFLGLLRLALPTRSLQGMPAEFIDGMKARAFILGDRDEGKVSADDEGWCAHWDPIWRANRSGQGQGEDVHVWISMNAQAEPWSDRPVKALEAQTDWLRERCAALGNKVRILATNGPNGDQEYQAANVVFETLPDDKKIPTRKEHFGFTDGIGDPVFEGQIPAAEMATRVVGRGKWMDQESGWVPLATGEFILGHPDESQELPPAAVPEDLTHNGTFMVYRKLHENLGSFRQVLDEEAARYGTVMGVEADEAKETLMAKMAGRWPDGVPLSRVPTYEAWKTFRETKGFCATEPLKRVEAYEAYFKSIEPSDFRYGDDMEGIKCPLGAHLRRVNTRDYLDPSNRPDGANPAATTQLNKRRRILRRGLPYGPTALGEGDDTTEQGVIFMAICANIFRQFEFVQQQWIQYGLDFNLGNHTCPMLGNHTHHKRYVIPAAPASGKPPYVMSNLKTFVETRGGDYFFVPSLTALRLIAMGVVDPT